MKLPEVSRALNAWQEMKAYNAQLLSEQTRLTKEYDQLREQNEALAQALRRALPEIAVCAIPEILEEARAALAKVNPK